MREIVAQNVGPSEVVRIPVPDGGGVVVLRGRNGAGKTKVLEAIETATTRRGEVEVRDGAERAEVCGFGVRMTVGRSTRRKGELEVRTLEGRMSLGELIDPGLQDQLAADSRRIKALVQLCGTKPSLDLFVPLVGSWEELERLGSRTLTEDCPDLVVMAERIKRLFEQEARKLEGGAEKFRATQLSLTEQAGRIEVRTDISSQQALDRHRDAAVMANQAAERFRAYELACRNRQEVLQNLKTSRQEAECRPTVEQARAAVKASRRQCADVEDQLARARLEVARLAGVLEAASQAVVLHENTLATSQQLLHNLERWQLASQQELPPACSRQEVEWEAEREREAALTVKNAEARERHCRLVADSIQYGEQAGGLERRGQEMRDAAAGCEQVLSGMVESLESGLRVEGGRLVLDTDRGVEPYGDLSIGERTPIALQIGCRVMGRGGLVVLPQELWEGLDPQNRAVVRELARQHDTVVVTAECSDDQQILTEVMT